MTTANVQDIGYAFLKTYYQRMHSDPSKLSQLYSITAELTHVNYQLDFDNKSDVLPTLKVIGKDNISNFYTRHSKMVQDVRVKIDACDFQSTGTNNNGVLILALGEICWSNTPTYRFCQTFILHPIGNNSKAYDVTNDIMRFIPEGAPVGTATAAVKAESALPQVEMAESVVAKSPIPVVTSATAVSKGVVASTATLNPDTATSDIRAKMSTSKTPTIAAEAPRMGTTSKTQANISSVTPSVSVTQSGPPAAPVVASSALPAASAQNTLPTTVSAVSGQSEPPKKMNWAASLTNSESKAVPNISTNYTRVPPDPAKTPDRRTPSPNGNSKNNNKKMKHVGGPNKDGFFPVYIRNTAGVSNKELTDALEKSFGTVKKITAQDSFAVVDFEDYQCQQDAIKTNSLRINNNIIVYMEPKTEKKRGPSSSNLSASTSPTSINGNRSNKKHSNRRKD